MYTFSPEQVQGYCGEGDEIEVKMMILSLKNEKLCIENEESCKYQKRGICIQNDEFCRGTSKGGWKGGDALGLDFEL